MNKYTLIQHLQDHNSLDNPIADCEFCNKEIYRRTHLCFGGGSSTIPAPQPIDVENK